MRRLLTFAAFLLVISFVPVCAQRSGSSRGSFGGHSGFGGMHSASDFHGASRSGFGSGSGSFDRGHHFRGGFHRRSFGRHCFGCYGYGYGYPYYPYYDPYWWYDSYSSYDEDLERDRAEAREMDAENREEQRMRQQDEYAYARSSSARMSVRGSDPVLREQRAQDDPATVLVFRDQHQREIHNYAIVGQTLWNFTPQRAEKISLAELDLPATSKANDDRGVDFRIPRSSEGQ